uniref:Uncharacterized protein n=1 Tax=Oryza sativa subsp. japonica TaxID=39947 RepID=Q69X13_ORYSJ|nr:hypothetical protein [Oryza sativa Japonica Group]
MHIYNLTLSQQVKAKSSRTSTHPDPQQPPPKSRAPRRRRSPVRREPRSRARHCSLPLAAFSRREIEAVVTGRRGACSRLHREPPAASVDTPPACSRLHRESSSPCCREPPSPRRREPPSPPPSVDHGFSLPP